MSRYRVTFAYGGRLPDSRTYEVAVDLTRDFEHVALLVATIPETAIGGRGRRPQERTRAVARWATAIATWAASAVAAGHLDVRTGESRRVNVLLADLDVTEVPNDRSALVDGAEVLAFES